jgi:hypothetical protein
MQSRLIGVSYPFWLNARIRTNIVKLNRLKAFNNGCVVN